MAEEIGKSNALCAAFYQYHFLQAYWGLDSPIPYWVEHHALGNYWWGVPGCMNRLTANLVSI